MYYSSQYDKLKSNVSVPIQVPSSGKETGRTLTCRLKEHKRAVSQGDFNASALAEHAVNTSHQIDWSNAGVLQFYYQRLYLESWYIQQHKDTLNRERGLLPSVY